MLPSLTAVSPGICSDLPDSYYGKGIFKKYTDGLVDRIDKGTKGLYLHSQQTGTGKSTVACAIALEYIVMKLQQDYRTGKRTGQLVKFINVADFLEDLRKGMDDDVIVCNNLPIKSE